MFTLSRMEPEFLLTGRFLLSLSLFLSLSRNEFLTGYVSVRQSQNAVLAVVVERKIAKPLVEPKFSRPAPKVFFTLRALMAAILK
jgi:hypothetical protein